MNLAGVLKTEIERIAGKVVRTEIAPARKLLTTQRKHIAALRRNVAELEAELKRVRTLARQADSGAGRSKRAEGPHRFRADGLRTFRERASFSAADLGRLLGVSGQTILNWESKRTKPAPEQVAALAGFRAQGVRELRRLLEVAPD
jgi:DNA-binding transcriptional regulator YiaG